MTYRACRDSFAGKREHFDYLMCETLGIKRYESARFLDEPVSPRFGERFARLVAGESVQYIVGHTYFYGLKLRVTPACLIPQFDSEQLVEQALALIGEQARVLDLGTGSGALALALKTARPHWQVTAVDLSAAALAVARENAGRLGLSVEFLESNWFSAVSGQKFDLVITNPPYLKTAAEAEPEVAKNAPACALYTARGTAAYAEIFREAGSYLQPGGAVIAEITPLRAAEIVRLAGQYFQQVTIYKDYNGKERVVVLQCPL